ncbi:hypothetical protein BDA99DRAFT_504857 [Phascolomyces articulosus]|uniref:F-box domain-containing protein n=1 Tax=Phascolomyces articulosus TaxID=60185 RepID=A0AAD5KD09_9FUNG|nr:hypothetical protein BDA99DRAFT_504857 [Phascolomyces articulosus]
MNDTESHNQKFGFLDKFTFDIIAEIFSYLNQRDCLNCMATCRIWYNRVPEYTTSNWKTIQLFAHSAKINIKERLDHCLGSHVKHVTLCKIQQNAFCTMLQRLKEGGCDEIESLELITCYNGMTKNHHVMFLNLLQSLAFSRLVELKMTKYNWNIALLDVLALCPHLTHFTYKPMPNIYTRPEYYSYSTMPRVVRKVTKESLGGKGEFDCLIYLNIDAAAPVIQHQAREIIQKCPHLQYYVGASMNSCAFLRDSVSYGNITLDYLLKWCPKLIHYADNGSYDGFDGYDYDEQILRKKTTPIVSTSDNVNSNNNNSTSGLIRQQQQKLCVRHLALCEGSSNRSRIDKYLTDCQDTLEHLTIAEPESNANPSNWTSLFQTIQLSHLRTLHLERLKYDNSSIIALLNTCRNTINEAHINLRFGDPNLNTQTIQQLQTLSRLERLTLHCTTFNDTSSVVALLERLPNLRRFVLCNNTIFSLPEQSNPFIKNLERIEFWSVYAIEQEVLIPALFDSMIASSLHDDEYKLKKVRLMNVSNVTFPALIGLAKLSTLTSLEVMPICTHTSYTDVWTQRNEVTTMIEKDQQDLLYFVRTLLGRSFENSNNNQHSKKKTVSKIEQLKLGTFSCHINYDILDALGDLPCLNRLILRLERVKDVTFSELVAQEKGLVNVDLSGIMELLRKGPKLKAVWFQGIASFGDRIPSDVIKDQILLEQQQKSNHYRRLQQYNTPESHNLGKTEHGYGKEWVYITKREI